MKRSLLHNIPTQGVKCPACGVVIAKRDHFRNLKIPLNEDLLKNPVICSSCFTWLRFTLGERIGLRLMTEEEFNSLPDIASLKKERERLMNIHGMQSQ